MTSIEFKKLAAVMQKVAGLVDQIDRIDPRDLTACIATRERHERNGCYATAPVNVRDTGLALTQTLKLTLFFRTELLALQPSPEDARAAVEYAKKMIARAEAAA